jgi:hypothetical protein
MQPYLDEAPTWQLDRIIRLLDERRVCGSAAARVLRILEQEPYVNPQGGHNDEIRKMVEERIQREP